MILKAPEMWVSTLLITLAQAVVGVLVFPWMLRQLSTFAQGWRAGVPCLSPGSHWRCTSCSRHPSRD